MPCQHPTPLVHLYHLHALDWVDVVSALAMAVDYLAALGIHPDAQESPESESATPHQALRLAAYEAGHPDSMRSG
jgi:Ni,Fe-hydrogenase I large subunit